MEKFNYYKRQTNNTKTTAEVKKNPPNIKVEYFKYPQALRQQKDFKKQKEFCVDTKKIEKLHNQRRRTLKNKKNLVQIQQKLHK